MKIALCQINTTIGDLVNNKKKIIEGYKKGQADKADLVIFPNYAWLDILHLILLRKKNSEMLL